MTTEADTCREYVVPKLQAAGWENMAEIIGKFGGADQLRNAVNQLQTLLYTT
jgi:type I site-specific restriction endonuclease